jgi:hypothetical protein
MLAESQTRRIETDGETDPGGREAMNTTGTLTRRGTGHILTDSGTPRRKGGLKKKPRIGGGRSRKNSIESADGDSRRSRKRRIGTKSRQKNKNNSKDNIRGTMTMGNQTPAPEVYFEVVATKNGRPVREFADARTTSQAKGIENMQSHARANADEMPGYKFVLIEVKRTIVAEAE